MSKWQQIETAPLTGLFMVYSATSGFIPDAENWLGTEFKCFFSDRCGRIYNVTHWHPYPPPPA